MYYDYVSWTKILQISKANIVKKMKILIFGKQTFVYKELNDLDDLVFF